MCRLSFVVAAVATLSLLAACTAPHPPAWTGGKSSRYPDAAYLIGVGVAPDRGRAEDRARAEIAKIFEVRIVAKDTSLESAWLSRSGAVATDAYRQQVQGELAATTDKVLQGVRIADFWHDPKGGDDYALAVLDRRRQGQGLRSALDELDREMRAQVRQAEATDAVLRRLGHLMQAVKALDRRREVAADLRVVDPLGLVPEPAYTGAELTARLERAARGLHLGIGLEGDREGIVTGALVRALAGIGIQLAPAGEQNLRLQGTVGVESYQVGGPLRWCVATAQTNCLNRDGTVLDALRVSVRDGSRVPARAETLAREELGQRLAGRLLAKIAALGLAAGK